MKPVFNYPGIDDVSEKIGLLSLKANNKRGVPQKNVLIGDDGTGQHYFLEQSIRQFISQKTPFSDTWEFLDIRISKSGEISQEFWGNEFDQQSPATSYIGPLKRFFYGLTVSFPSVGASVSTPSIKDIFPSITSETSTRLIIIENEYKDSNFDDWLINLVSDSEITHYLLVLSDPPKQIISKLKLNSPSLSPIYMPLLPDDIMTRDLDNDNYKDIRNAINKASQLLKIEPQRLIGTFKSSPGLIFDLAKGIEEGYENVWNKFKSKINLTEKQINALHATLLLLDEGATEEDFISLLSELAISLDNSDETFETLEQMQLIQRTDNGYKRGSLLNAYYKGNKISIDSDVFSNLDTIIKRRMPWNYAIRAEIAKLSGKKRDVDSFVALDVLSTNSSAIGFESDDLYINIAIKLKNTIMGSTDTDIHSLRETSYILLNSNKPLLLEGQFYLILIQYAKFSKIESLVYVAIEGAIPIYKKLRELNEYDMQFRLGIELASDIRNYNLDRHYSESTYMFADIHELLYNPNIMWPEEIKLNFKILLIRHLGVFNDLETQHFQLTSLLTELTQDTSNFYHDEKIRLLTNLIGITLCVYSPTLFGKTSTYINCLTNELTTDCTEYKAFNNVAIGNFLQEKWTVKKTIKYLIDHCYSNNSSEITLNPIPKISHKIVHMNLALLMAEENKTNISKSLNMLIVTLSNSPQDDFYRFYIGYNRSLLKFMQGNITKHTLLNRLLKLKIPALFEKLETGDLLYRRLDSLIQILDDATNNFNYNDLKTEYKKVTNNSNWLGSLFSRPLLLYSDLQYWD